jgi:cytochrome P450
MHAETHASTKEATPTPHTHKTPPDPHANVFSLLSSLVFGSPQDLLGIYMNAARDFGDAVRFPGGSWAPYFFHHPDAIKHVLQDNNHNYSKQHRVTDLLKPFVGEGLLTSDGEPWRRRRRLAQPAFHRQRLALLATLMTEAIQEMLQRWEPTAQSGRPIDILVEMQRVAVTIVGRALFHTDVGDQIDDIGRRGQVVMEYFNYRSRHLLSLPVAVPTRRNRRVLQAVRESDEVVYQIIHDRRQSDTDRGDLLSMLLAARDEETGEGLSDKELRDEVQTFLGAGNETTAVTLAWAWYLLSRHPEVDRQLRAELSTVLGDRVPTFADLPQLQYTRMIIDETLRLYPPAWAMLRSTIGEDEIGGYHIPAKALVILSPYVTQRRTDFWQNPEGFDPERFTPECSASRPRYAYFPFGGGPRQCIGNEFALMEATLVLATVAQRYRLHLVPGHPVEPYPIFTLRPRQGVLMTLHAA